MLINFLLRNLCTFGKTRLSAAGFQDFLPNIDFILCCFDKLFKQSLNEI